MVAPAPAAVASAVAGAVDAAPAAMVMEGPVSGRAIRGQMILASTSGRKAIGPVTAAAKRRSRPMWPRTTSPDSCWPSI